MDHYTALAMLISAVLLKLVDDAFDEGMFSTRYATALALLDAVLCIYIMLDREGFILIGAIFWSSLLRGKVDNIAFRAAYAVTGVAWTAAFLHCSPFPMDMTVLLPFLWCVLSAFLVSGVHDLLERKESPAVRVLVNTRALHLLIILPLPVGGLVSGTAYAGITAFVLAYAAGGYVNPHIAEWVSERGVLARAARS